MASLFHSFRSSSMPKRLLRYALSRLELLDAEALDIDNLDFALGRNTVFEFRDVGIKLKKLEKLLQLPATLKLQKAGVMLLRVTIPMDFYTSPITVHVQGVDVRLSVTDGDEANRPAQAYRDPSDEVVPDPVHLAQSFLETQPSSERQRLEEALVAETQDLGASISASDDSSEDEPALGTGHSLSLPEFLADFLQGIIDRMQVKITNVRFELGINVRTDASTPAPEPVSLELSFQAIEAQGVTAMDSTSFDSANPHIDATESLPTFTRRGKRLIRLANVRAFLSSEASVIPPDMQESTLSQGSFRHQPMASLQASFRQHLSEDEHLTTSLDSDSEMCLHAPYHNQEVPLDETDDCSPPSTPRASLHADFTSWSEQDMFHSTADVMLSRRGQDAEDGQVGSQASFGPPFPSEPDQDICDAPATPSPMSSKMQDLAESHLYTHEEAESMYMSALSSREPDYSLQKSRPALSPPDESEMAASISSSNPKPSLPAPPRSTRPVMPGTWDVEYEGSTQDATFSPDSAMSTPKGDVGSENSSPAFSRAASTLFGQSDPAKCLQLETDDDNAEKDGMKTPKGPARVVKKILDLEKSQQLSSSSFHLGGPGAFSYHDASGLSSSINRPPPPQLDVPSAADVDNILEVILSPLSLHLDASVGLILAKVVETLLEAFKRNSRPSPPINAPPSVHGQPKPSKKTPDIKFTAEEISIDFLNRLNGIADSSDRHCWDPPPLVFDQGDVLLNASLQNLAITVSSTEVPSKESAGRSAQISNIKIDTEKFRLGYPEGDIISFDSGRPMTSSIVSSAEHMEMAVETLPLIVQLDLQRLDETLGWFGGLSGFLSMNMSATSSGVPSPNLKPAPLPVRKSRGVHFETPNTPPVPAPTMSRNKVNVRIGGSLIELVGRDRTSVAAESKALKIVIRDEGMGAACSGIRLSGPYLKRSAADAPITADIGGVRLELSTAPKDRDLEKLLELIIPSKVKFDDGNDGDDGEIMVDTLLRQRRKGSVLTVNVDSVNVRVANIAQLSPALPNLADELTRLSSVATRYLPEDDRPGLLTLATLHTLGLTANIGGKFGKLESQMSDIEVAHVTVPSLVAVAVRGVSLRRNEDEDLVGCAAFDKLRSDASWPSDRTGPVVMARMIVEYRDFEDVPGRHG
ncbi:hypothetical protein CDD81_5245 [Ophiocordyceps australis]|uniref:Autophagy-related protein 2 n=1 Tax=Ophiocordyceps australis TaxID=1399860 RepID=A0A2C5YH07_9HYPO|nr:hypothetical protein CDD81_5245 [Ophiocordyceps australis]